ncbi:MAG: response regulator [Anaerolineae bacterium]|nr:response regulator [Anaerolineae bacterium]
MARVLVVDDNLDLLRMVQMLLEERGGHQVVLSTSGEDALEKARANPPDLAIIDVMMPGMTGYELCRRLRQEPSTAHIPILILTARGQPIDRETALASGADDYLAKPVTMSELLDRVNRLLARGGAGPTTRGVLAMLGLRGGVGVTTMAVNLALALARSAPEQVCLVDLSPSSGHLALHLGLRPDPNWSSLSLLPSPPGTETLRSYLITHSSGVHLLAAPFVPVIGGGLQRDMVMAILSALQATFSAVVVDLPTVLTEGSVAVLEAARAIGVVTTPEPAALQTTIGTLQALKPFHHKVHLIVNQIFPGHLPSGSALQRILRHPISAMIPFEPKQSQALAQGKPLLLGHPDSPFSQAVLRLGAEIWKSPALEVPQRLSAVSP